MNINVTLKVTEIQRFCMHDGPGVRTTVFLKGCPLRCAWCHNPETQNAKSELLFYESKCVFCNSCLSACAFSAHMINEDHKIDRKKCMSCFSCVKDCPTLALEKCGNDMSIEEILSIVEKDRMFYASTGGITLSGGEPFAQGKSVLALLKESKVRGLSTAVETCGYADENLLLESAPFVDLFLWDIKDTDDNRHKQYTGISHQKILENLNLVNETGAKIRLRCILINGINTDKKHYFALAAIAKKIRNFDGLEILPYHSYGGAKSIFLGLSDNGNAEWIPSSEQVQEAKSIFKANHITVL